MQISTLAYLSDIYTVYKPQLSIIQQYRYIADILLSEISDILFLLDTDIYI